MYISIVLLKVADWNALYLWDLTCQLQHINCWVTTNLLYIEFGFISLLHINTVCVSFWSLYCTFCSIWIIRIKAWCFKMRYFKQNWKKKKKSEQHFCPEQEPKLFSTLQLCISKWRWVLCYFQVYFEIRDTENSQSNSKHSHWHHDCMKWKSEFARDPV